MKPERHPVTGTSSVKPPPSTRPTGSAEACHELGREFQKAEDFTQAEAFFLKAVDLSPREVRFHFSLGRLYQDSGRPKEAVACYTRVVELDAGCAAAHYNLGLIFLETRRLENAVTAFQQALKADPQEPAAFNNLGIALEELGRSDTALACFDLAASLNPNYAEAHCNAGRVRFRQERWEESILCFHRAVAARPDHADAWHNMGLCFHKRRDFEQARACYDRVLSLNPTHHAAHLNQGNICLDLGDLNGMADWYRKALDLAVSDASACTNVGRMLEDLGRPAEAMECFDRALAKDPGHTDARFNRAALLLKLGRWSAGWEEYEWRFKRADWRNAYPHRLPALRWDGRRFAGKTLLVHCEQGLGDAIQFARYLPQVKALGGTVLFEAPAALTRLFRGLRGIDELLEFSPNRMPTCGFDFQVPLLSLPGVFKTSLENIPADVPYLTAEPAKTDEWGIRLAGSSLKVGIVWAASGWNRALADKSCRLSDFMTLATVPEVRFYGLQKGEPAAETAGIPDDSAFVNLGVEFADFSDTAALIANLDLIISVDTAVAHLAGAMGTPVWVLLPFCADWRWMVDRDLSPWYPTMRLFRQQAKGDWTGVFMRVRLELDRWANPSTPKAARANSKD